LRPQSMANRPRAATGVGAGRLVAEMRYESGPPLEEVEVGLVVDVADVRPPRPGRDWMIATLATMQYGVVSRAQLLAAGIGPGAIATRLKRHQLLPLHRGVYAVGHTALVPLAREMAAVLACGPGAVLSHWAAAWVWRLLELEYDLIEVTVPRTNRRRPGLRIHRSRSLGAEDVCMHRGIPVTTPARTLLDLADVAPARDLERAFDEAMTQRLTSHAALVAVVERSHGHRGTGKLRDLLTRSEEPALTRSEAEERFLALLREAGLPAPEVNASVGAYLADFAWRERRLVVEVDGYRFHSSRAAFERDRRRDAELNAAGFRVVRITWRQLVEEPVAVIARLARALAN
jgi:very-short-patch-repair endonuclease